MKRGFFTGVAALPLLFGAAGVLAADPPAPAASTNAAGPRIHFAETSHDFGRAQVGDQVKYTFVFTNTGDQTLEVANVSACHCITANWTRSVEPGKTGNIPIIFNSSGLNGSVSRIITVSCNDPQNRQPRLQLNGVLWQPIEVNPASVRLSIAAGTPSASMNVRIINHMDDTLTLSDPESSNKGISAELKTVTPGKEFQLVVTAAAPSQPGAVQGDIKIKTSSTNVPAVNIPVFANVMAAVTVFPNRITLPIGTLTAPITKTVTVINNGTGIMELSDPVVNVSGVNVELKQLEAGHRFTATMTFPQGFELPGGKEAELSIKCNQPAAPVVKVLIAQALRPSVPQALPIRPKLPSPTGPTSPPVSANQ